MAKFSPNLLFYWVPAIFVIGAAGAAERAVEKESIVLGQHVVNPADLQKSLLFDQNFDKQVIRPLPRALVAVENRAAARSAAALEKADRAEPAAPVNVPAVVERFVEATTPFRRQSKAAVVSLGETFERFLTDDDFDISRIWIRDSGPAVEDVIQKSIAVSKKLQPSLIANSIRGSLMLDPPEKVPELKDKTFHAAKPDKPAPAPQKEVVAKAHSKEKATQVSVNLPKTVFRKGPAEILVIDEDSFLGGAPRVVPSANVFWGHPSLLISSRSDSSGRASAPAKNFVSARFVVQAEGYLPAVGYAVGDMITPVLLIREKRLAPVLKSLGVTPVQGRTLVWGKLLSADLRGHQQIKVETSDPEAKTYYSTGTFGLFHTKVKESGAQGDFLISSLARQLHYLLPTESKGVEGVRELAPALLNLEGLGPVVTTTVVDGKSVRPDTQVVDGMSMEKPDTRIMATIGGVRGLEPADDEGIVEFPSMELRNQVDLVELRANGYLKTWLNAPGIKGVFPELVSLFNRSQLNELLFGSGISLGQNEPVVLGQLRPEVYRKRYTVELYNTHGQAPDDYRVVYFDAKNRPNPNQSQTDQTMQTFAVVQLPAGEYHMILRDAGSKEIVSMQLLRASEDVISQVQF